MNYFLAYQRLIAKAQSRGCIDGYVEKHHILPRALGGTDDSSNLVVLTAREHFIAHVLLGKIYGGTMWQAIIIMKSRNRYCNSRLFEIARKHAFVEREKCINEKRKKDPAFDAYMHKVRSEATKNRQEGYQAQAGKKFKEKFLNDIEYSSVIKKQKKFANQKSLIVRRLRVEEKARKVKELRKLGKSYLEIKAETGYSIAAISLILNNKMLKNIGDNNAHIS